MKCKYFLIVFVFKAKSCTLPNIIVEPDNISNSERGIKRSIDHDPQPEVPEIIDIKVEDEIFQNEFDNDLHYENKIKVQ